MTVRFACHLAATDTTLDELAPADWAGLADVLAGILAREPFKSGRDWASVRLVLGTMAGELYANAAVAGEEVDPRPALDEDGIDRWLDALGRRLAELETLARHQAGDLEASLASMAAPSEDAYAAFR